MCVCDREIESEIDREERERERERGERDRKRERKRRDPWQTQQLREAEISFLIFPQN